MRLARTALTTNWYVAIIGRVWPTDGWVFQTDWLLARVMGADALAAHAAVGLRERAIRTREGCRARGEGGRRWRGGGAV